jgi:hypothetical protein
MVSSYGRIAQSVSRDRPQADESTAGTDTSIYLSLMSVESQIAVCNNMKALKLASGNAVLRE